MTTGRSKTDASASHQILALPPSKAQQRQIQIVEAAIKVFAAVGIEKATYAKIAKACRVTRPLIQHYFPDKEQLFELVVKYIRGHFQQLAVRWIEQGKNESEQLENYVASTFEWIREYPEHVKVWILFFYLCGHQAKYRKINTALVGVGTERIAGLLEKGTAAGRFRSNDFMADAKLIQTLITGSLVSLMTEDLADDKAFEKTITAHCLELVRA